ncbi:aspartyl protease family protein [Paraglaciecola sp.]|uniref:aspartyl protease family protein n=1 Tax=Paraglaciecola sp. TaxID=1920173 RepID=UPI0030F3C635
MARLTAQYKKKLVTYLKFTTLVCCANFLTGCDLYEAYKLQRHNQKASYQWSSPKSNINIPFQWHNGHIVMSVNINGSLPLRIAFDTGAPIPVLFDSARTQALKLESAGTIKVGGTGAQGDVVVDVIENNKIQIGSLSFSNLSLVKVPSNNLSIFSSYEETYFDGAIGYDILNRFIVEIDNDNSQIILWQKNALSKDLSEWFTLPIVVSSNHIYLDASLSYDEVKADSVRLLIDTGSTGYLSLAPDTHPQLSQPKVAFSSNGSGLSGISEYNSSTVDTLSFAKYNFTNVPTQFSLSGNVEDGRQGILGNMLLKKFNIIFDYSNKKMYLRPSKYMNQPMDLDRSGLMLLPHVDGAIIKSIAAHSSASQSKLQVGDIITSFAKKPVTRASYDEFKALLSSKESQLPICWLSKKQQHCDVLLLQDRL